MLIVLVLVATVFLRLVLVALAVFWMLPRGPLCPSCEHEMARVRTPLLSRVLPQLERRWCMACGWGGVVRRGPPRPRRPSRPAAAPSPPAWD